MYKVRVNLISLFIIFVLNIPSTLSADYIFSAPPREASEKGEDMYGPIAEELSKVTGKKIVYEPAKNWTEYSTNMRNNKYDIVFDGPHFTAWRMKHFNHKPVAKLVGTLGFVVVTKEGGKISKDMREMIGKSVCGLASPNLGTMVAYAIFNNPVKQPEMKIIKGGWPEVIKAFNNDECSYAVLNDRFYKNMPIEQKQKYSVVATSEQMPNQAFTVSSRVSDADMQKIKNFMTSEDAAKAGKALLNTYSKKNPRFVGANTTEFTGLEELLEGVVFGW